MLKTLQYFNSVAPFYDDYDGCITDSIRERFYENPYYEEIKEGKILDVCSGTGIIGEYFLRKNWDVFCLDGAPNMLNKCYNRGLPKENFVLMDLEEEEIPIDKNTFNIIVCLKGLIYLNNACDVVREMIELTKPGGAIVFNIPHHEHSGSIIDVNSRYTHPKSLLLKNIIKSGGELVDIYERSPIGAFPHEHHNHVFTVKKMSPHPEG